MRSFRIDAARRLVLAFAVATLVPCTAFADLTGFYGSNRAGEEHRRVKGFAIAKGGRVAAVEFEYAKTDEDNVLFRPPLTTFMISTVAQSGTAKTRLRLYAVTGAGGYREELPTGSQSDLGFNYGAGVKLRLAGPLGVRLDYRRFSLRGTPTFS